jgi:hypothetical protein
MMTDWLLSLSSMGCFQTVIAPAQLSKNDRFCPAGCGSRFLSDTGHS